MSRPVFALYRFINPNGTAKEWAYADLGGGRAEVRWGRADHLVGRQEVALQEAKRRADEKERKGYRFVGRAMIGDSGTVTHHAPPSRRDQQTRPTLGWQGAPAPAAPTPEPPTPPPAAAPADLAALLGGDNDGFYF